MVPDCGRNHQFIGVGLLDKRIQLTLDRLRGPIERTAQHRGGMRLLHWAPEFLYIIDRRRQQAARATHHAGNVLLRRSEQALRRFLCIRDNYIATDHYIGFVQLR